MLCVKWDRQETTLRSLTKCPNSIPVIQTKVYMRTTSGTQQLTAQNPITYVNVQASKMANVQIQSIIQCNPQSNTPAFKLSLETYLSISGSQNFFITLLARYQ